MYKGCSASLIDGKIRGVLGETVGAMERGREKEKDRGTAKLTDGMVTVASVDAHS